MGVGPGSTTGVQCAAGQRRGGSTSPGATPGLYPAKNAVIQELLTEEG
jgi:hypothetical protein